MLLPDDELGYAINNKNKVLTVLKKKSEDEAVLCVNGYTIRKSIIGRKKGKQGTKKPNELFN